MFRIQVTGFQVAWCLIWFQELCTAGFDRYSTVQLLRKEYSIITFWAVFCFVFFPNAYTSIFEELMTLCGWQKQKRKAKKSEGYRYQVIDIFLIVLWANDGQYMHSRTRNYINHIKENASVPHVMIKRQTLLSVQELHFSNHFWLSK